MDKVSIDSINDGIQDWLSIMDYEDPEQIAWCRRNITFLRREIKKNRKENNRLS